MMKERDKKINVRCCGKEYEANKIILLAVQFTEYPIKLFDFYSDTACPICGESNLKFYILRSKNLMEVQ